MTPTAYIIVYIATALMWLGFGMKLANYLAKGKSNINDTPHSFQIEDELSGFSIQGTIHPDSEASHRCEVWVYDEKERINRVRMCGSSMLHVIQAATAEAIKRLNRK